jgi:antitoxin component HigA of HigAB toxin-antitoxin module
MSIKSIKSKQELENALKRVDELWQIAKPNTPEGDELESLVFIIQAYERQLLSDDKAWYKYFNSMSTKDLPVPSFVLAKATLNASAELGLKNNELGAIIGLHRTGITRLKKSMSIDPESKTGEISLTLVRLADALHAVSGGDKDWINHFMRSYNTMTSGIPAEQIQSLTGLMTVSRYLDAIRAKI